MVCSQPGNGVDKLGFNICYIYNIYIKDFCYLCIPYVCVCLALRTV